MKPLLYVYRVLLTGIHLMKTGRVEANLVTLNDEEKLRYINDLNAQKLSGPEKGTLSDADLKFYDAEYQRMTAPLEQAYAVSTLPELPSGRDALNDLLVRLRLSRQNRSE